MVFGALNTDSKDIIQMPPTSNDPKMKAMMEKLSNIGEMDPPPGFDLENGQNFPDDDKEETNEKVDEKKPSVSKFEPSKILQTETDMNLSAR